ncbi:MAG TPA: tRNA preQ1(34) S-adenosylmethionine ribosyltransferase-isomerase QueA [Candidatus Hydrogenedentes bacterium]|nr:tRNA preQ1(34) S-adenosylmethionine ribosyltransferase-isomerase QueA [Candidatus Hydrogenedentota bacterium]HQE82532.1 tRNA preQ1(34) S-adenosylmethionine ribosyltransferase-isomerase QueA [Candidatus Hydrogenedentota bacterium]HQH51253.1 tRNA preQ1(34) S-adenosylmethionine ribosyltransferase-isomerase QueA [Candidatus Hydrogenedentota bacterium]HQM47334.1 tRNA preQ1(34) S-adenosylmethionine ribosyltransferase-isomerase QueA [Candidatus Hydrogenedentota bacterium]
MKTSELDYQLPEELIAQHPCEQRDESRLLVLNRAEHSMTEDVFRSLPRYLRRGDCLVLNDTRVIRARLHGRKPTGGQVEVFLLHAVAPGEWDALVRPSSKVKPGTVVRIAPGVEATVGGRLPGGRRHVSFAQDDVLELLEKAGEVPLPPYIHRDKPDASDLTRYQTIYANVPGAVAAPTAGLHFTDEVFRGLDDAGVVRAFLTLHVGYGTFRPIQTDSLEAHVLEPEEFILNEETASGLNDARATGGRIAAVGTTVARVLETQYRQGVFQPGAGETNRYIYPPYAFQAVDVLQTNFHLPRSSLLALVCAFGGTDFILEAYRFAVKKRFRFYSYGDAMLIL